MMFKLEASWPCGYAHCRFIFTRDLQNFVRAELGIERRALQKIERAHIGFIFAGKRGNCAAIGRFAGGKIVARTRIVQLPKEKFLRTHFADVRFRRTPAKLFRTREGDAGRMLRRKRLRHFRPDGIRQRWDPLRRSNYQNSGRASLRPRCDRHQKRSARFRSTGSASGLDSGSRRPE